MTLDLKKRVGRPARADVRKQVPTFFPLHVREAIKKEAEKAGISMSDWLDVKILMWLTEHNQKAVYIAKTHPRKDSSGTLWAAVQVVLMHDTFDRLQQYARRFDVSVAGVVYTIAKGLVESSMNENV